MDTGIVITELDDPAKTRNNWQRAAWQFENLITAPGGLRYIAKAANYTAVNRDLVGVDSTSSSRTITLPASPVLNNRVGVFVEDTTAPFTVTIARNGNTINGASADVVLYLDNDYAVLHYTGSGWLIVGERRQPHKCVLRASAAQSIADATATQLEMDNEDHEAGCIGTTGNPSTPGGTTQVEIKRAGQYRVSIQAGVVDLASGRLVLPIGYINSISDANSRTGTWHEVGSAGTTIRVTTAQITLAASDVVIPGIYRPAAVLEPGGNCLVSQSGGVVAIADWDVVTIGAPKPTPEEIEAIAATPEYATWLFETTDSDEIEKTADKSQLERRLWRALFKALITELNVLRDKHGLAPRTAEQVKNFLRDEINMT
jgi:hypothetical protein